MSCPQRQGLYFSGERPGGKLWGQEGSRPSGSRPPHVCPAQSLAIGFGFTSEQNHHQMGDRRPHTDPAEAPPGTDRAPLLRELASSPGPPSSSHLASLPPLCLKHVLQQRARDPSGQPYVSADEQAWPSDSSSRTKLLLTVGLMGNEFRLVSVWKPHV